MSVKQAAAPVGSSRDDMLEISRMLAFIPELGNIFHVKEKVGEGTFSKVYRAVVKHWSHSNKKEYALKYLVPTSRPCRIASELQCLKQVGGTNNIVGIELCLMHHGHVVIVMPYFPHQRFVDYVKVLTASDIRDYMKNLFIALARTHAHGIIHRDVKPNNFLFDRESKRYALVDFGLAQRLQDNGKKSLIQQTSTTQPFKEHNVFPLTDKSHRNDGPHMKQKTVIVQRKPNQSMPSASSQKRSVEFNQENGSLPKRRALDLSSSGISHPIPSRSNILPTPPHTPSSRSQTVLSKPAENISRCEARRKRKNVSQKQCLCFAASTVCKTCLGRAAEEAPRGGTPGFRAPEVLLKYKNQTTAVDMWSAGVILLSMLSRTYPFFRAEDDLSSLGEIILLVGVEEMKEAAAALGKSVTINLPGFANVTKLRSSLSSANYLKTLCTALVNRDHPSDHDASGISNSDSRGNHVRIPLCVPDSAYDLLNRLLDPNPITRITAKDALLHPFIQSTD